MSTIASEITSITAAIGRDEITFETGKLAKQADGAVVVRSGDTMVLATAQGRLEAREGADFFPLTVDVEERMYAAGKIPGGFFKREGRPTEKAILTARMIDRPIRPLWPKGFRNEVQVICTTLSADLITPHDILAINGASAALMISPLPFLGPVGAVRIGIIDGELVVNPSLPDIETSELDLIVVGTKEGLTMVEAGANEIPEDTLLEAFEIAHAEIKKLCELQEDLRRQAGKPKWLDPELTDELDARPRRAHLRPHPRRRPPRGRRRGRGDRRRALPADLDRLDGGGHRPRDAGARQPRRHPRAPAASRPCSAPVRAQFEDELRVLTDARAGLEAAPLGEAPHALRPHPRDLRAAVPGRAGDGRGRRADRQGQPHEVATSRRPRRRSTRS